MEKMYYSISEVAEMFQVNLSNLRFWEKEFKQLKPRRNAKGTRFYSKEDILLLKKITYLVNDQKLTLAGAKIKLAQNSSSVEKQQEVVERLRYVRQELLAISKALDV